MSTEDSPTMNGLIHAAAAARRQAGRQRLDRIRGQRVVGCSTCGRSFVPTGSQQFCSEVCQPGPIPPTEVEPT